MYATVYEVQGQLQGWSYLVGLDHFDLRRVGEVPADRVLEIPGLTLYAFDDDERRAVFVETPPEIDLTTAPFYYLAQKEHARSVYTLPYSTFNDLARTLPDPEHLILLHSIGRCGSTLLCWALGALGEVVTLSEPDTYTRIPGIRPFDGSRDAELTELIGSANRFHCHRTASNTVLLKFRGWCTEMADLLYEAFPDASALFLGRALEVFEHDSQTDIHLSGRTLRAQKLYELGDDDIRRAEAVARRYGLDPDIAAHLPGHLLSA